MDGVHRNLTTGDPEILRVKPETYRILECIYVTISLYIFLSFLFFLVRPYLAIFKICKPQYTRNTSRNNVEDPSVTSYECKSSKHGKVRRNRSKFHVYAQKIMTALTFIMSVMVLLHVVIDLWAYSKTNTTSAYAQCVRHIASGLLYIICGFCLYGFLWIRQRAFYAHPVLKHLAKPSLIKFSWSVLITIIATMLAITILFFLPQITREHKKYALPNTTIKLDSFEIDFAAYGIVPVECGFQRKEVFLSAHFILTMMFLYFQVALQFLFAYPIYKQRKKHSRYTKRNQSNRKISTNSVPAFEPSQDESSLVKDAIVVPIIISSGPSQGLRTNSSFEAPVFYSGTVSPTVASEDVFEFDVSNAAASTLLNSSITINNICVNDTSKEKEANLTMTVQNDADNHDAEVTSPTRNKIQKSLSKAKHSSSANLKKFSSRIGSVRLKEIRRQNSNHSSLSVRKTLRDRARLKSYVIRCLCVSLICFVSDILAFLFTYFAQWHVHDGFDGVQSGVNESLVSSLAYNANVIVNLVCMLACYKDWKLRLFPWYFLYKDVRLAKK